MKKQLLGLMTVLTVLGACQKNEVASLSEDVTIYATIEEKDVTRTVMDENNNILWSENDQIIAFMKSSFGYKYQVKPSFIGKSYAEFSMVSSGSGIDLFASNEWDHNVAYYPYSEDIECLKSGANYALEVNLPSEQVYVPDSFANGSMAMVAVSENNNITFKNVLGGIKLQLKGTQIVKSIKIEGKNNEKLSGAAVVTAYTDGNKPAITMASDASTSVTLNCGDGVQLNESTATEFIITLPAVQFCKGFIVIVTDNNHHTCIIETDQANTIYRSSLLIMPEVTVEASTTHQTGDYIDEYGVNHGTGIEIDGVVWAPVNCGYHETDFKWGKLYQWGRKYGQGYDGRLYSMDGSHIGEYSDTRIPWVSDASVSVSEGNDPYNENVFYLNWLSNGDESLLWNMGSESVPVKTEYDPCPEGWRVPTGSEIHALSQNFSSTTQDGISGILLSGLSECSSEVSKIFFPFGGYSYKTNVSMSVSRGETGFYWTSTQFYDNLPITYPRYVSYYESSVYNDYGAPPVYGFSVRCVKEGSGLIPVEEVVINNPPAPISVGDTHMLSATVYPSDATVQSIIWFSNNQTVATVDQYGRIKAKAPGTATITAKAGIRSTQCEVTVIGNGGTQNGDIEDMPEIELF